MRRTLSALILIFTAIAFFACNDGVDYEKLRQEELAQLREYIDLNYPGAEPTSSGLYYFEEVKGSGDTIKVGDRVQIFYATWTIDSFLVDQTSGYLDGHRYEPYEFTVGAGNSINGLDEAATYMQEGTKCHLVINSELAYGQNGSGTVGGFQTILMEIEVYKVIPFEIPETE